MSSRPWIHYPEYGITGSANIVVGGQRADFIPAATRDEAIEIANLLNDQGHDEIVPVMRTVSSSGRASVRSSWSLIRRPEVDH